MMKNFLLRAVRFVLYPLFWCWQVVQDAPIISCDNDLIGAGAYNRLATPDAPRASRRKEPCGRVTPLCSHAR